MTRERMIIDALLAALRTPGISGVIAVYEERGWAVPVDGLPAIDVAATTSEAEVLDVFDAQLAHTLRVDVAVVARETSTLGPSAAADAIVAEAHRRIRQNSALAALVRSVTPRGTRWERQESGDGRLLRRVTEYEFDHVTAVDDLEIAP
jgi:hypothetical protein